MMEKSDCIIAIILYRPRLELWRRIQMAMDEGYQVYLFDNSPALTVIPADIRKARAVRCFTLGDNAGIGFAMRQMCATAYYEGYRCLLYFDQDTVFTASTLKFISSYRLEQGQEAPVAADKSASLASVTFRDRLSASRRSMAKIAGYSLQIVDFTINSGTLFYLDKLRRIGWHDPSFFIDGVDYAYCLAASQAGYEIAEISEVPGLNHAAEQADCSYRFLGKSFVARRYPRYRRKDFFLSSCRLIFRALR